MPKVISARKTIPVNRSGLQREADWAVGQLQGRDLNSMISRTWSWVGLFFVAWAGLADVAFAQSLARYTFTEPHLGTIVDLTLYAPTESVANEAARSAFARVKELDLIFSDYKADSELMRLCAEAGTGRRVKVSSELFDALKLSLTISEQSEGAFDVTIGPLVKLWRTARKQRRLPTPEQIVQAKELVGWKLIRLDENARSVELLKKGMQLDFGGMAKGLIAHDVIQKLRERDIRHALIAISGDIVAGDSPPGTDGWKVAVARLDLRSKGDPKSEGESQPSGRLLKMSNCAVSTSGDQFQFVEIDGVRYSHIVDPITGKGMTRRSSVTVVAPNGALADVLDTAACLMGPERGLRLIERYQNVDAIIVQANDGTLVESMSKGFTARLVSAEPEPK